MPLILKNVEFKGATMGSLEELKQAVAFADKHKIRPVVHTVLKGLEKAEEGFQIIDRGLVGMRSLNPTGNRIANLGADSTLRSQFGKIAILVEQEGASKL
jgi:hypothetical protein